MPFDCFENVVVVEEAGSEHKYWAPGVGGILTEPLSGAAQETEQLINVRELSPTALAELSAEALGSTRTRRSRAERLRLVEPRGARTLTGPERKPCGPLRFVRLDGISKCYGDRRCCAR